MLMLEEIDKVPGLPEGVAIVGVSSHCWKPILHDDGTPYQFEDTPAGKEAAGIACKQMSQERQTTIRAVKIEAIYLHEE